MNCKYCNEDLTPFIFLDGFKFCPFCGTGLNGERSAENKASETARVNLVKSTIPQANLLTINAFNTIFELIKCPAGKFLMGSPEDELGRCENETQHEVTIADDFYIGRFPVTQAQFEAVTKKNPSCYKGPNNPVDCINWHQAKDFCLRLNEATVNSRPAGYLFDLPTEAQWEYACRANTTTSLNSGKNICYRVTSCPNLDELGWYEYNAFYKTHPVGQKKPNSWGIYDMHGNLSEWCRDYYLENYLPPNADPDGEDRHAQRVTRNASFRMSPSLCRSAYRFYHNSYSQGTENTFRLALVKSNKLTMFFKVGEAPDEPSHWLRRDDD
ncbi:MAG: formylglycine-generating enzyme family protein [Candidatus Riflebacteria bacterium]|nr:formylglycine-generating enzyme family protein [Candidatus Riflebacteria bacterium]